jgi:hypothetical protein
MKKLQNNFTTAEQSKRLLELGVPADSADCMNFGNAHIFQIPFQRPFSEHLELHIQEGLKKMYTPCWSVGRLIEIYEIVGENAGQCVTTTKCTSRIDNFVQLYEENATLLDFSKLDGV